LNKMIKQKLIDKYNRHLNYLRISITDRCNLQCMYCMPPGFIPRLPHDEILRYEEIIRIIKVGISLGIFLEQLADMDGLRDIALTTNGVSLKDNIQKIKVAGIKRLNISLDTLSRNKYKEITGHDRFDQVWEGIELAYKTGFDPIKLNMVALSGVNDDELADFARLSFSYPFHIRFIEYMPIGKSRMKYGPLLLVPEIKKRISTIGKLIPVKNSINDGPAERYKFEGAKGEIGFIGALSHHFCNRCNRPQAFRPQSFNQQSRKGFKSDVFNWRLTCNETFQKCSILFKFKEGENFNHRNTWSISRIKI